MNARSVTLRKIVLVIVDAASCMFVAQPFHFGPGVALRQINRTLELNGCSATFPSSETLRAIGGTSIEYLYQEVKATKVTLSCGPETGTGVTARF